MWSTRVGAEVMKPLATPVLGGMVSSLLHVLIVTPVIFFWLHERRLGLQHEALAAARGGVRSGGVRSSRRSPCRHRGCRASWSCGDTRRPARRRGRVERARSCRRFARGRSADFAALADRHAAPGPQRLHDRIPIRDRPAGRRRRRSRQREHGDARNGDVRAASRCSATASPGATRPLPNSAWRAPGTWPSSGMVRRDTGRSISKGRCNEQARRRSRASSCIVLG